MSTRARRQQEFARREKNFLQEAHRQICADGLLSLHMAKVARACDYATGTLYQHFASKEDMVLALSTELMGTRLAYFRRAARWQAETRARQFALSVGDMLFAKRHPEHFQLAQYVSTQVVWGAATQTRRDAMLSACQPITGLVCGIVDDAIVAGDLDPHGRRTIEMTLGPWTMTLGMHTLVHSDGLMEQYDLLDPYLLLLRQLHLLLNGMGWRPFVDAYDDTVLKGSIERVLNDVFPEYCKKPQS
jgi:AcrR family transcriptional regulator